MGSSEIVCCRDPEDLARQTADLFTEHCRHRLEKTGGPIFCALTGGRTPVRTYQLLAGPDFRTRIFWERVTLFLGDERHVPHGDRRSNYRMVVRHLLTGFIPKDRLISVPVHLEDPREAANAYAAELQRIFRVPLGSWPRFDLILLGLGDDGHTASLFPGSPALKEETRWVVSLRRETEDFHRISLTFPVINRARRIAVMVSGKEKAAILRKVLLGPRDIHRFPAQGISPVDGSVQWLVDREAASLLSMESLQEAGVAVRQRQA